MSQVLDLTSDLPISLQDCHQAIDQIMNKLRDSHGLEYLNSLSQALSQYLNADYFMINSFHDSSDTMETTCIYSQGNKGKNFVYDLECTPCRVVLKNEIHIITEGVISQYPEDHMLKAESIESYSGFRIGNSPEDAFGIIVCLFKKPVHNPEILEYIFRRIAGRVGAELIVHHYQQEALVTENALADKKDVHDLVRSLGISLRNSETRLKSTLSGVKKQTELYGVLSHEIRNSLTGILSVAHLLKETELDKEQDHLLGIMINAGSLIKDLMENMLDASSMRLGELSIQKSYINLESLLKDCYSMFYSKQTDALELQIETENLPAKVYTDGYRLQQVLLNLLGNAFKFTERGKISLIVKGYELEGQPYVSITVKDTGLGIPGKFQKKLFEAFEQGDAEVKDNSRGVGLGLYISNNIVHALGGKLSVESMPGKGSAFSFSIQV